MALLPWRTKDGHGGQLRPTASCPWGRGQVWGETTAEARPARARGRLGPSVYTLLGLAADELGREIRAMQQHVCVCKVGWGQQADERKSSGARRVAVPSGAHQASVSPSLPLCMSSVHECRLEGRLNPQDNTSCQSRSRAPCASAAAGRPGGHRGPVHGSGWGSGAGGGKEADACALAGPFLKGIVANREHKPRPGPADPGARRGAARQDAPGAP